MKHRALSILTATFATFWLASGPAAAHPGHGLDATGTGLVHFLLQPTHGGLIVVVAVALLAASLTIKRSRRG